MMEILNIETRPFYPIEQEIMGHSRKKDFAGYRSNRHWQYIHSPMDSEVYGYNRRFGEVLEAGFGMSRIEEWVDNFRIKNSRNPVVMEFMGPVTLLERLETPGIYVNWDADNKDGITFHNLDVGSRVGINGDIEDLEHFLPRLRVALDTFGGGACLDLIIWKAEGARRCLLDTQEAFNYWYELQTGLLQPGGIALIEGYDCISQDGYGSLDNFADRLDRQGNGRLVYTGEGYYYYMLVENYDGGPLGVFY